MKTKKQPVTISDFATRLDVLLGKTRLLCNAAEEIRLMRQDFYRAISSPLPALDPVEFPDFPKSLSDSEFADAIYMHCDSHDPIATLNSLPKLLAVVEGQVADARRKADKLRERVRAAGSESEANAAKTLLAKHTSLVSALQSRAVVVLKVFFNIRFKAAKHILRTTKAIAETLGEDGFAAEDCARAGALSAINEEIELLDNAFIPRRNKFGNIIKQPKES